jgi:enoyl-CoA hydratase/carnithine racemase
MLIPQLRNYAPKYPHVRLHREDGILEVTLHSQGGELVWDTEVHEELSYLFQDLGQDPENKVIILTGTGDSFIHRENIIPAADAQGLTVEDWIKIHSDGSRLLKAHLDIPAPMIAAINGPATIHSELGLLCDITLAAEEAYFADLVHFPRGVVPADGVQIIWPLLIGLNRARYFLLTGQKISAERALDLGVVNEVLPKDGLLMRARELARALRSSPPHALNLVRKAMVHQVQELVGAGVGYGLALEALANIADSTGDPGPG